MTALAILLALFVIEGALYRGAVRPETWFCRPW